jgi:hypothetical protein
MATNGVLSCEGGVIWISRRRAMMPAVCSPGETSATSASAAARRRCELFISWGRSTSAGSLCCPRRGSGTPYKQASKLTGAEVMPATDESSPWPPRPVSRWSNPGTLANWRGCGRGPRYVRLGRRVVYRIEDLEAYLDEHTVAGDEEAKHSKPLCDAPSPSMSWDATRCAPGGGIHGCSQ